jgi:predicted Fe-S protein YdhL (DUF1289 family)
MVNQANPPADAFPTPCVRNCCLDDHNICLGCHRSLAEILAWANASNAEKTEILARCAARRGRRKR